MTVTEINDSFYETTGNRLSSTSILRMFNILQDPDNTKYINIFRNYDISDTISTDIIYFDLHDVSHGDWWDNISNEYYGTPYLWWTIAIINNVMNPFEELEEGESIKILKEKYLYKMLRDVEEVGNL